MPTDGAHLIILPWNIRKSVENDNIKGTTLKTFEMSRYSKRKNEIFFLYGKNTWQDI